MTQLAVHATQSSVSVPEAGKFLQVLSTRQELEIAGSNGWDEYLGVGTFVQMLPGSDLVDEAGRVLCEEGDRGRVSGFVSTGAKRILVTWERNGLTSSVMKSGWQKVLRIIGEVPVLREGVWFQVLPKRSLQDVDGEIYGPADFGVVVELHSPKAGDIDNTSLAMVSILWTRSQRISTVSTRKWPKYFRYAKTSRATKIDARERQQTDLGLSLEVGALVQAKRLKVWSQCGDYCGREYFEMSDLGRISGFMLKPPRMLVTWQRTGNTSSLPRKYWSRFVRIIGRAPILKAGDWLQALPMQRLLDDSGTVVYGPGDFGLIVEATTPVNATPYFVLTWSHSKRNCTVKSTQWPRIFRLAIFSRSMEDIQEMPGRAT